MEFSSSKFSRDERYKAVERMKEREALFVEYIQEMKKNKKEAEKAARTQEEKVLQPSCNETPASVLSGEIYCVCMCVGGGLCLCVCVVCGCVVWVNACSVSGWVYSLALAFT